MTRTRDAIPITTRNSGDPCPICKMTLRAGDGTHPARSGMVWRYLRCGKGHKYRVEVEEATIRKRTGGDGE